MVNLSINYMNSIGIITLSKSHTCLFVHVDHREDPVFGYIVDKEKEITNHVEGKLQTFAGILQMAVSFPEQLDQSYNSWFYSTAYSSHWLSGQSFRHKTNENIQYRTKPE